jgi:hypothetical protein
LEGIDGTAMLPGTGGAADRVVRASWPAGVPKAISPVARMEQATSRNILAAGKGSVLAVPLTDVF